MDVKIPTNTTLEKIVGTYLHQDWDMEANTPREAFLKAPKEDLEKIAEEIEGMSDAEITYILHRASDAWVSPQDIRAWLAYEYRCRIVYLNEDGTETKHDDTFEFNPGIHNARNSLEYAIKMRDLMVDAGKRRGIHSRVLIERRPINQWEERSGEIT